MTDKSKKNHNRIEKRRDQLIQAAIKLFSQFGYHATTVKEVAEEAGVSTGLVYQYMPDKQDLLFSSLLHICQRNKEEIPAALQGLIDPIEKLYSSVDAYTRVVAANQQALLLTYRESKSLKPEYIKAMKRMELETNALIANCVNECIDSGFLKTSNVELLVYRIITGAHAWSLKYWRLSKIVSLSGYLEQSIHPVWTSQLTTKGTKRIALLGLGSNKKTNTKAPVGKNSTKK
jgi:AcrR family transcriptional regulator